jgi:hypothetical protein
MYNKLYPVKLTNPRAESTGLKIECKRANSENQLTSIKPNLNFLKTDVDNVGEDHGPETEQSKQRVQLKRMSQTTNQKAKNQHKYG